jgi:transcription elongation GreA/GreB family factor/isopentenyldiphosphate isomerase
MSRGFVKDGDQEEIPMVPPRAFLPDGMTNYVTTVGMDNLLKEKSELLSAKENISGNETDVRVTRNFINAKLELLEERIRSAVVIEAEKLPKGRVGIGTFVTLLMEETGAKQVVKISGADEADVSKGFISYFSPLAVAILGHSIGERVEIAHSGVVRKVRIVSVSFTNDESYLPPKIEETKHVAPKLATIDTEVDAVKEISHFEVDSPKAADREAKENANEIFPIVNERGITIGRAARWECHNGKNLLHPVVHLHVFNSKGDLFLQKRPLWKDIQPGKWDTSVGGHVAFGEKIEAALQRETMEELGLKGFSPIFIKRYVFESTREKELIHVYKTIYDGDIVPSSELDGGRFWRKEEIMDSLGKQIFTPNFESEYKLFFKD